MNRIKLSEIAGLTEGSMTGENCDIYNVASLTSAKNGEITFVFDKKFIKMAESSPASAFIITEGIELRGKNCVTVKNGHLAQAKVLAMFYPEQQYAAGLSQKAFISPGAQIEKNVVVMDFAYVSEGAVLGQGCVVFPFTYIGKNARIGTNVRIYPHAVVMDNTEIGNNSILHPGAVIGADGFGYVFDGSSHVKIPQVGRVVIKEDVEIGANTTIDRAAMDVTEIGKGTKIDNLVMIGHNVTIGNNCVFAGQAGIAGSAKIGDMVVMGGQAGVRDHVVIDDNVMIAGGSGVAGDVGKGAKVAGFPAVDFMKWLKVQTILERLPEMRKKLNYLLKKFGDKEG